MLPSEFQQVTTQLDDQGTQYTVPAPRASHILKCLHNMTIKATMHDLEHPTSNRVLLMYEALLDLLAPWLANKIKRPDGYLHTAWSGHPELGNDFAYMMSIHLQMQILTRLIGYNDFQLQDVSAPTSARLLEILNKITHYVCYSEERWKEFEPFAKEAEEYVLEAQKVTMDAQSAQAEIAKHEQMIKDQESEVRKLEQWCENELVHLDRLRASAETYHFQSKEKKSERKAMHSQLAEIHRNVTALMDEVKLLNTRVNYDHDQVQARMLELKQLIRNRQDAVDKLVETNKLADRTAAKLNEIDRLLVTCIKSAQVLVQTMVSVEQQQTSIEELDTKIEDGATKIKEAESRINALRRQIAHTESKTQKISAQLRLKKETLGIHLDQKQEELEQANAAAAANRLELNKSKEVVNKLQRSIDTLKHDLEKDVNRINDLIKRAMLAAERAFTVPRLPM
ncbi:Nuf2 family-domain-containing protein [Gongronella butleri]|nr:Nuf2 family-domain-containing protein [Gongronella butleri]